MNNKSITTQEMLAERIKQGLDALDVSYGDEAIEKLQALNLI